MAEKVKKVKTVTQEEIMQLLDKLYANTLQGVSKVSPPLESMANDYLQKSPSVEVAAKTFVKYQIAKCTTSGFLTGLGGLLTLPVSIPANISSVLYVQMRMIACLAYMGGYDIKSDQVQTMVYACLAGISVDHVLKHAGVKIGTKFSKAMVGKIPGTAIAKINKAAGFKLITKFGKTGIINLGKSVMIIGGFIGGGFDFVETKLIANRAYNLFIKGDIGMLSEAKNDMIEVTADRVSNAEIDDVIEDGVYCTPPSCEDLKAFAEHAKKRRAIVKRVTPQKVNE